MAMTKSPVTTKMSRQRSQRQTNHTKPPNQNSSAHLFSCWKNLLRHSKFMLDSMAYTKPTQRDNREPHRKHALWKWISFSLVYVYGRQQPQHFSANRAASLLLLGGSCRPAHWDENLLDTTTIMVKTTLRTRQARTNVCTTNLSSSKTFKYRIHIAPKVDFAFWFVHPADKKQGLLQKVKIAPSTCREQRSG